MGNNIVTGSYLLKNKGIIGGFRHNAIEEPFWVP